MKIGEYLKRRRLQTGITQRRLAENLGYTSAQFISNLERGVAPLPLAILKKLKKELDCDRSVMLDLMEADYARRIRKYI